MNLSPKLGISVNVQPETKSIWSFGPFWSKILLEYTQYLADLLIIDIWIQLICLFFFAFFPFLIWIFRSVHPSFSIPPSAAGDFPHLHLLKNSQIVRTRWPNWYMTYFWGRNEGEGREKYNSENANLEGSTLLNEWMDPFFLSLMLIPADPAPSFYSSKTCIFRRHPDWLSSFTNIT